MRYRRLNVIWVIIFSDVIFPQYFEGKYFCLKKIDFNCALGK